MTITKDTLLHLNWTLYWDDDGCPRDSLEEAKENSMYPDSYTKIRQQYCYFYEYNDLSKEEKENAEDISTRDLGCTPKELMYVVSKKNKQILVATTWDQLQRDVENGMYSIVQKEMK